MRKFEVYDGPGFEIELEVEDREAEMVSSGLLSWLVDYVVSGFNQYASLEKVARVDDENVKLSSMVPPIPSGPFSRLVNNQLKRIFLRKRPLESLMLISTSKCQCDCKHCIVHGMEGDNELSTDELKEVIDEAVKLGAYHVSFEGGEPTLRDDIVKLIDYVDESKATTHLISNGINLNEEFVDDLSEAGLGYLHVSLDSPYPEEHNQFRGFEGVFEKASKGVSYGVEKGMLGVVEYTAHPGNVGKEILEDLYSHAQEIGVDELLLDEAVPGGKWEMKEENILSEENYKLLNNFMEQKNSQEGGPRVSSSYSYRDPEIMGCFGGRRWMWITPNGEMLPCFHTPISFGNVRDKGIKTGWKKMGKHFLFQRKACTWKDLDYQEDYFPEIQEAAKEGKQPKRMKEIESKNE
ncbi:hypothetical protein C9439_01270 [archaeon SCG-AAA382B04]|nr:hypothetical protein C9439_01270 [archaeon SCG-AAA382B04]